jgi:hypothetical protein
MQYPAQIAAWTAGSFLISMALLLPAKLDAVGPTTVPSAGLESAKITDHGAELSLLFDGRSTSAIPLMIKPGASMPLEFVAKNPTDQSVDLHAMIAIDTKRAPSPMSRTVSMPTQIWQQEETLTLLPGETKTISLSPAVHLTEGNIAMIQLSSGVHFIQPFTMTVKS